MRHVTLAERFMTYQKRVLPVDAPLVQIVEARRAFLAGCHEMLTAVQMFSRMSEDQACERLYMFETELVAFMNLVRSGGDRGEEMTTTIEQIRPKAGESTH